jgi:hypothetical protein
LRRVHALRIHTGNSVDCLGAVLDPETFLPYVLTIENKKAAV